MATDTKNESAPQEVSPNIAVGDGGKRHLKLSYKQEFKRLAKQAVLLIIFLAVLAGLGVLIRDFSHRNVAFRIEGTNYSKASITEMANFAAKQDGLDKKHEAGNIYNLYKIQISAQKAGIAPNA